MSKKNREYYIIFNIIYKNNIKYYNVKKIANITIFNIIFNKKVLSII